MDRSFDKFTAIQLAEKIAAKEQAKFTALGYEPFLFLVEFEDMSRQGWWGCYYPETDLISLDIGHWQDSDVKEVYDTLVHEMVHMYVDRFHHKNMQWVHGKEFCELYEKVTGKQYIHYGEDLEKAPRSKEWDALITLGTIRVHDYV